MTIPKGLENQLKRQIRKGLNKWTEKYSEEVDRVIETPGIFPEFPDSDIINTGRLLNSKKIVQDILDVTFSWNPVDPETKYPYAPAVWGGFFKGSRYIEGRQWDLVAYDNVNAADELVIHFKSLGYEVKRVK